MRGESYRRSTIHWTGLPRSSVSHWLSGRLPYRSVYRKIYKGIDLVNAHMLEYPHSDAHSPAEARECSETAMPGLSRVVPTSKSAPQLQPQLEPSRLGEMCFKRNDVEKPGSRDTASSKDIEGACSKCPLKGEPFVDGEGSGKILIVGGGSW